MSSWDDLLAELQQKGYAEEDIDRIRRANDASGLRQELKAAKEDAKANRERAAKYEDSVLQSRLEKLGVKVNPTYLKRPDDLDISDNEAVTKWLTEAGLYTPTPSAPTAELQQHDKVAEIAGGGTPSATTPLDEKKAKLINDQSLTEDQFFALAAEIEAETAGKR